jgi:hypothetical protein
MNQIEELVRATLSDRIDQAPAAGGLLAAVHHRSRRRRRHRRIAAGAALIVVAGLTIAAPSVLSRIPGEREVPADATIQDTPKLVAPTYILPVFPFTPGTRPGGTSDPTVLLRHGAATLTYPAATQTGPTLTVLVSAAPFTDGSAAQEPRQVRGHDAVLGTQQVSDQLWLVLSWQESPIQWVQVMATGMPADELLTFAEALTPRPFAVPLSAPFTFDLVPDGWQLTSVTDGSMVFGPPTRAASADNQYQLVIDLEETQDDPPGSPIEVAGRSARLAGGQLAMDMGDGHTLYVHAPAEFGIPTLIRFAAGVHLTPQARPGAG